MVTPVLVAMAALFGAQGVMQVIRVGLASDGATLASPPLGARPVAADSNPGTHATNAEKILARNPFDSVTGPLGVSKPESSTEGDAPAFATTCDGVKVLIIAASTDPDWSFAALSGGDATTAGAAAPVSNAVLRRRGGEFNGKKIEYVGTDRVWLNSNGSICQARLFPVADEKKPAVPAPAAASAPTVPGRTPLPPEISKGIRQVSATEWDIERGVMELLFERQGDFFRHRIVPVPGKGIQIFGVGAETVLGKLGIQNADVIQQINGFDAGNPEKMLEALGRLRTANHLTMSGTRNTKNFSFDYNIK